MNGAYHIGTFFRIPVKIHWTFGLLLLFIGYVGLTNGFDTGELFAFGLYIFVLFICVVLHEYGHALMARRFGVKTRDIILSPIGGVARLESIPEDSLKEFWIALAGPSVNVGIAIFLSAVIALLYEGGFLPSDTSNLGLLKYPSEFLRYVLLLNIALFFFNLIPAFPMDGGRVLRSLLALPLGRKKATQIASWVGKILAIAFIGLGLYSSNLFLSFIGVFVFVTAGAENKSIQLSEILRNTTVNEIMRTNFTRVHIGDKYQLVQDIFIRGGEKNFLVFDSLGHIIGTIPEMFVKDSIKENEGGLLVSNKMSRNVGTVSPRTSLYQLYAMLQKKGMSIVAVQEKEFLIGVIDRNMLTDFIEMKK